MLTEWETSLTWEDGDTVTTWLNGRGFSDINCWTGLKTMWVSLVFLFVLSFKTVVEKFYHMDWSVIAADLNLVHLWLIIYSLRYATLVYYVVTNALDWGQPLSHSNPYDNPSVWNSLWQKCPSTCNNILCHLISCTTALDITFRSLI